MGNTNFGRDYGSTPTVNGAPISTSNPLPSSLDAASLAALETTELGATTLAALENTTAAQGAPNTVANAWPVLEASRAASTSDVHEPASNTAAVVTYAAGGAGVSHVIGGIAWSYSGGTPTGGNLKITDDGATVFSMDITAAGAGVITLPRPKRNAVANKALVITLAAGGSGVTGKLSITSHWLES